MRSIECIASISRLIGEKLIGNSVEGSGHGLI
jgi:hypothetical protein